MPVAMPAHAKPTTSVRWMNAGLIASFQNFQTERSLRLRFVMSHTGAKIRIAMWRHARKLAKISTSGVTR